VLQVGGEPHGMDGNLSLSGEVFEQAEVGI
jgi:hypothetical protein